MTDTTRGTTEHRRPPTRDDAIALMRPLARECSDAEWFAYIQLFVLEPTVRHTPMDLMPLGEIDMELSDRSAAGVEEILLSEPSEHPGCPDWDEVRSLEQELSR